MKGLLSDPHVVLAADGTLYVNAASVHLANRAGRRTLRFVELTPREQQELRRRIASLDGDLLVGLVGKRGGAR